MTEKKWPSVSFIVCTYNCKDYAKRCFESIKVQDYPGKVEMIAVDSYSTDGTIETLKKFKAKIIFIKARPEGKKGAKWAGYQKAKGDIVIFIDSDNKLVEKDWTKKMVKPLIEDKSVNFCICRMAVVKTDNMINRYLSLIGTDPFASYKSIDSLLALRKIKLEDKGDYWTYNITPKNFIITGGYYFAAKKETLEKIGGYTQDTDVVYNLSKKGIANVAIPKNTYVHHLITKSIIDFIKKKIKWGRIFFESQIHSRDFNWIPKEKNDKIKLILICLKNILFIPEIYTGVKMAIKDKESVWLMHSLMTWLTTVAYVYAFLISKFSNKKIESVV